jgi:hypothetical protein
MNRATYPVIFTLFGAVLAVIVVFVWRGAPNKDRLPDPRAISDMRDFREEFLAELRTQFPAQKARIAPDHPDSIIIGDWSINLTNLWKRFQETDMSHEALKGIVRDSESLWSASARMAHDFPKTYDEAKHRLFPQILPPAIASNEENVRIPFADSIQLGIVVDSERSYAYLTRETLKGWGQTADKAYADAIDNLEKRSHGMQLRQFHNHGATFFVIATQDGFDSARITLPKLKKSLGGKLGFPFYFGVPNREFLICWSGGDKEKALQFAREKLRHDFEQQPYPLSPHVFQVAADGAITLLDD